MKRKAFTLIELLAVILVLAIIALITVPILLKIVENVRKESFKDTAYGIIEATKLHYAKESLEEKVKEEIFNFPSDTKLKITGERPKNGSVRLFEDGKIEMAVSNNA